MKYIQGNYIQETIVKRPRDAHKGDFGKVLVFAGSAGMAGAAVLCAKAALKSGAGLVRFLLPSLDDPIYPILQISVPEATCVSFKDGMDLGEYTVIAAGSGLGREQERSRILSKIIETYSGILLLDADALNLISSNEYLAGLIHDSKADTIITPHAGEARRLLDVKPGELFSIAHPQAREDVSRSLVEKYSCISVLKGSHTIVSNQEKDYIDMYENTTGNPGMATAGSGDVLSGVIAGLAAQNYAPVVAARCGVYIHGLAGNLAAHDKGEMGITAMDIAENIPYAIKAYYK